MSKKVLVVCHGNINRSAAAEAVLSKLGVHVFSAGVKTQNGRCAAKKARDIMGEMGYDLEGHRSKVLTLALAQIADIILYMDNSNLERLRNQVPGQAHKFRSLAAYIEETRIPDPNYMKRGSTEEREAFEMVVNACVAFKEKEGL